VGVWRKRGSGGEKNTTQIKGEQVINATRIRNTEEFQQRQGEGKSGCKKYGKEFGNSGQQGGHPRKSS